MPIPTPLLAFPLALLLVLAVPTSAEAEAPLLEAKVGEVDISGLERLTGDLVGMHVAGADLSPTPIPGTLHAERILIESEYAESTGVGVYGHREDSWTQVDEFQNATLDLRERRGNYVMTLFPQQGGAEIQASSDGRLSPSEGDPLVMRTYYPSDRPDERVRTDRSTVWERQSGEPFRVVGSFYFTLWEWDSEVTDADGNTHDFPSGFHEEPRDGFPEGTELALSEIQDIQTYIYVENGTFELSLPYEPAPLFYFRSVQTEVEGSLRFHDADGILNDGSKTAQVEAERLELVGSTSLRVMPLQESRIPVLVEGTEVALTTDGSKISWVTAPAEPSPVWSGGWFLLGPGAVLISTAAAGAIGLSRRKQRARMEHAENLLEIGAYEEAVECSAPILGHRHLRQEVAIIQTESLLRMGRYDEAVRILETDRYWTGPAAVMRDYLMAVMLAKKGDASGASKHLKDCLARAPDLWTQATEEPLLHRIVSRMARSGAGGYT